MSPRLENEVNGSNNDEKQKKILKHSLGKPHDSSIYRLEPRILLDATAPALFVAEILHADEHQTTETTPSVDNTVKAPQPVGNSDSHQHDGEAISAKSVAFSEAYKESSIKEVHTSNTNPVLMSAADITGSQLSGRISVSIAPEHGNISIDQKTGNLTYSPKPDYQGLDQFLLQIEGADLTPHPYVVEMSIDSILSAKDQATLQSIHQSHQSVGEVVFVDEQIANYQPLIDGLDSNAVVFTLNAGRDGVEQITEIVKELSTMEQFKGLDAIHILSHGTEGQLYLGNAQLNLNTINGQYADHLGLIKTTLNDNADVLIYGCDFGHGALGRQTMESLAKATGADIAASTDNTGTDSLTANWLLEANVGLIEAHSLHSSAEVVLAATPTVTVNAPAQMNIGETANVSVTFDNTNALDSGYGPWIDVFIDRTGKDGQVDPLDPANPHTGDTNGVADPGDQYDGFSLSSNPSYFGTTVKFTTFTLDDGANGGLGIKHPYAVDSLGQAVYVSASNPLSPYYGVLHGSYTSGDQLVVIELPFGSVTPSQPSATVSFGLSVSNYADVGVPLGIKAVGGFRFGNDPLNNPTTDPSLIGTANTGSANVGVNLATLTTSYNGSENETATGPNYLRTYRINVDIANGQTLSALHVFDELPAQIQFVAISGSSHPYTLIDAPSTTLTGGTFSLAFNSPITGTSSEADAWVDVQFYVPRLYDSDANGTITVADRPVLSPNSGADVLLNNQAYGFGSWVPVDPRDISLVVGLQVDDTFNSTDLSTALATAAPNATPEHANLEVSPLVVQKGITTVTNVGASGYTPGDVLEFSLNFQISDYYAFDGLNINDTLLDGLRFDASFTPTLAINGNTFSLTAAGWTAANYVVSQNFTGAVASGNLIIDPAANDGSTTLDFNISNELVSRGRPNGQLLGGGIDPNAPSGNMVNKLTSYNDAATTGTITYRAIILDKFTDNFPSGEPALNPHDALSHTASLSGNVLDLTTGTALNPYPGPVVSTDNTVAGLTIASPGTVVKSIYAVNGDTNLSLFKDLNGNVNLQPGDVVTYRFVYNVPSGDIENLRFTDFLPLPIFDVDDIDANGVFGGINEWQFVDNTANVGVSDFVPGHITYGPSHNLNTVTDPAASTPTLTIDSTANSIKMQWGSFVNTTNDAKNIDILLSATVNTAPFADGLFLTNQVQSGENSTQAVGSEITGEAIVQIVLGEPEAFIYKGVVASTQGGTVGTVGGLTFDAIGSGADKFSGTLTGLTNATAIGALDLSDATKVDAGDRVRFALVAMNTGRADAFDVCLEDSLPSSYVNNYADSASFAAATNFQVLRGDGSALISGFDYTLAWSNDTHRFQVELTDNYTTGNIASDSKAGALSRGFIPSTGSDVTNGSNAVVILYDLTVATTAQVSSTVTNTASLTNYAGSEGGGDHTAEELLDSASVVIASPTFTKTLTGTSVIDSGNNADNQAVIGELITYTLTITVPEGTTVNAQVLDTLASGLAFVDVVSVTTSTGVAVTGLPGTGPSPANVVVADTAGGMGNQLTFNLGNISNTNVDNAVNDTLVVVYRAVVINTNSVPSSPGNQAGTVLGDSADLSYEWNNNPNDSLIIDPDGSAVLKASSASLMVVEPVLTIDMQASKDNTTYTDALTGIDAGDVVYYRIRISNPSDSPTAFDLTLNDVLPATLATLSVSSVVLTNATGGMGGTIVVTDGGSDTLSLDDFTLTGSTLSLAGGRNIDLGNDSRLEIIVRATIDYAAVPNQSIVNHAAVTWSSVDGSPALASLYNLNSTERTGSGGPGADAVVLNNYSVNDATVATIMVPSNTKTIVASSEDFTTRVSGTERVAIGEIVRYRLQVAIPEGSLPDLQIVDNLPVGMVFINDGTATLGFVSDGNSISSSTFGTSPNLGSAIIQPTFLLTDANISTNQTTNNDAYDSGTDVRFKLGDISNAESDSGSEYVIIEFNALVLDTTANQSNTTLSSSFTTRINGNSVLGNTPSVNLIVAEPNLTVSQSTSTTGPVNANDSFFYTITLTNNASGGNAAPAFDIHVLDLVDQILTTNPTADLEFLSYSLSKPLYTSVLTDASDTFTDKVDLIFNRLNPGDTITITVNVQVKTGAFAGAEIENKALVTYTSLPGVTGTEDSSTAAAYGTTDVDLNPGADSVLANADANNGAINLGLNASERSGDDFAATANDNTPPSNNAVRNNYAVAAHATAGLIVQMPSIDKSFQDGTISNDDTSSGSTTLANVVIGETVTYDLLVTLPEGVTQQLRVEDMIPPGLRVDSYRLITDGSANLAPDPFSGAFETTPSLQVPINGGSPLTIDFGDVTLPGDGLTTNNRFVIRVIATVVNVPGNQQGVTLANTAHLVFNDPDGTTNTGPALDQTILDTNVLNDPKVTIVEPTVTIVESVNSAVADAGDPITYTITITNSGSVFAYDVKLSDTLNLLLQSPVILSDVGDFSATGFTNAPTLADFEMLGQVLQSKASSNIDMDPGSAITIKVQGVLSFSVSSGQSIDNKAEATFTSLDGDAVDGNDADERTGVDGVGGGLNDYAVQSTVVSTGMSSPTINKVFTSSNQPETLGTDVSIGEEVTYTLTITLAEGLTENLSIIDLAQDNVSGALEIISAQITNIGSNLVNANGLVVGSLGTLTSPGTSALNNQASFSFGNTLNLADNVVDGRDQITITGIARVANLNVNHSGDVLSTIGRLVYGPSATTLETAPVEITVVEPHLSVTNTMITPTANLDAGDTVTYQMVLSHTGSSNANAYDIIIADTLPSVLENYSLISAVISDGATSTNVTSALNLTAAGALTTVADLDLWLNTNVGNDQVLTIVVSAKVKDAAEVGTVFNNTVNVAFSSLNGGLNGAEVGTIAERTGAGSSPPNDYIVTDAVNAVTVGTLSVTKVADVAQATSGDVITYTVNVSVAEGQTVVDLTDTLPSGVALIVNSANLTIPAGWNIIGFNPNSATQHLTIINPGITDNSATLDSGSFSYTYQVRVLDVPSNDGISAAGDGDGQTLLISNLNASADLNQNNHINDPGEQDSNNTVMVTVVEPKLVITTIHNDADHVVSPGQMVSYTLQIDNLATNGSTATAYDIRVWDLLPSTLTLDLSSITVSGATLTNNLSVSNTLDLVLDNLPLGSSATITFNASVSLSVVALANIDNNAKIFYDSLAADEGAVLGTGNTVFGETDGTTGDRDYGAIGPDEVFSNNILNEQDTDRVIVGSGLITDLVWYDLNNDGLKSANEPGIAGVQVWLDYNQDGMVDANEPVSITDANGNYYLANLAPGAYNVKVLTSTLPDAAYTTPTYDFDGIDTPNAALRTLATNEVATQVDFGYRGSGSIGDLVWHDLDANAQQNGLELGISGVTINLIWDANGNGVIDGSDTVMQTTTTNSHGNYVFSDLISGGYIVAVTDTANRLAYATLTGAVNDPKPVILAGSDNHLTVDFGYQGAASLYGRSYHDQNKDSSFNSTDTGIGGVTMQLFLDANNNGVIDGSDSLVDSTTTTSDGLYSFNHLLSRNYIIHELQPDGYGSSQNLTHLIPVSVLSGDITGNDFGNTTGSLAGQVYRDSNDDGLMDVDGVDNVLGNSDDEIPIAAVSVTLSWSGPDGVFGTADDKSTTTLTGADGNYLFDYTNTQGFVANGNAISGLLSTGFYRIVETQPRGYLDGADAAGNASVAAGDVLPGSALAGRGADEIDGIKIDVAQDGVGYLFGERLPSSINGSVHDNPDNNRFRESTEMGIPNSEIVLTGFDQYGRAVHLKTISDASGSFRFDNLYPSDLAGYTLTQFKQPVGYLDGIEGAGTAGGFEGVEYISGITLGYNVRAIDYSFGETLIVPQGRTLEVQALSFTQLPHIEPYEYALTINHQYSMDQGYKPVWPGIIFPEGYDNPFIKARNDTFDFDCTNPSEASFAQHNYCPSDGDLYFVDANGHKTNVLETEKGTWTIQDNQTVQFQPADGGSAVLYQVHSPVNTINALSAPVTLRMNAMTSTENGANLVVGKSLVLEPLNACPIPQALDKSVAMSCMNAGFDVLENDYSFSVSGVFFVDEQGHTTTEVRNEMGTWTITENRFVRLDPSAKALASDAVSMTYRIYEEARSGNFSQATITVRMHNHQDTSESNEQHHLGQPLSHSELNQLVTEANDADFCEFDRISADSINAIHNDEPLVLHDLVNLGRFKGG